MTADLHAHVIVPEILLDAEPSEEWRPRVYREDGAQVVEMGGRPIRAAIEEFVDVDAILEHQAKAGIDMTVLAPWVPLLFYDVDPEEGLRRCRIQNDALAALARAHPGRIGGLGAVPLQDPELAAAELRALMAGGDLHGVEVAASVRGDYLGDDRFEPFWAAAEETGALVFIHPSTRGFDAPVFGELLPLERRRQPVRDHDRRRAHDARGRDGAPAGLRVLLAHAGGSLLALRGRLRHAHSFQPQARSRLSEPPEDSIRRFFFDTITHDPRLLRDLVEFAGPEQVVLGTDYPFDMGDLRPLETLRASGLVAGDAGGDRRGQRRPAARAPERGAALMSQTADVVVAGGGPQQPDHGGLPGQGGLRVHRAGRAGDSGGGAATEELLLPGLQDRLLLHGPHADPGEPAADRGRARIEGRLRARVPGARPGRRTWASPTASSSRCGSTSTARSPSSRASPSATPTPTGA